MATRTFVVSGLVCYTNGKPLTQVMVQAFNVELRTQQLLGQVLTDATGKYSITYTGAQFGSVLKESADLKVLALSAQRTILAQSDIAFRAGLNVTVDLVVGGTVVLGPSEFDALNDAVRPLLNGLDPADLTEDDQHQDVTFLAAELEADVTHVWFLVIAYQMAKTLSVIADVLYGLFRQDVSTDLATLLGTSRQKLQDALYQSLESNIIRELTDAETTAALDTLARVALESASGREGSALTSIPLANVLKTAINNPLPVLQAFAVHAGTPQEYWSSLSANPDVKDHVDSLQFAVQLGTLTLNHTPLIAQLQKRSDIQGFADLTKLTEKNWLDMLNMPAVGVPDNIPGSNVDEQKQNFARIVSRIVEDAVPTRFTAQRLSDVDDDTTFGTLDGKAGLQAFFKNNVDFDFTTTRVSDFIRNKPSSLNGIDNPDLVKQKLSAVQRLYSVAPSYKQIRPLLTSGFHSALQIYRIGRTSFLSDYSEKMGGPAEADQVFDRAAYNHYYAFNMYANYSPSGPNFKSRVWHDLPSLLGQNPVKAIPDWNTLFGSADMCSCDGCRAMDRPAAYLVDLLHFLKDRRLVDKITRDKDGNITQVSYKRTASREMNVKDILFTRRLDLGVIELSCENTNTPVPYIDLTNEILENATSPLVSFTPFDLPQGSSTILDKGKVDGSWKSLFNPPLSNFASVIVGKPGVHWRIMDIACSYGVESDQSKVHVQSRNLQTSGTAQERAATPQYLNSGAYDILSKQVWPWNLPFLLSWETVRTYLAHLGVDKSDLMQATTYDDDSKVLVKPEISREYLGISTAEALIITGKQPTSINLWNVWGFKKETLDNQSSIPDPNDNLHSISSGDWITVLTTRVDVFLQQSSLLYTDLLNIIGVGFLFNVNVLPSIAAVQGALPDTCQLNKLQILGATGTVLDFIHKFVRLWRRLSDWSILDLAKTMKALGASAAGAYTPTDQFIIGLSHIKRLQSDLGLDLETLLTFWTTIETRPFVNYSDSDTEQRPMSFYQRTFCNSTIARSADSVFNGSPEALTGKLSLNISPIIAALNLSAQDITSMIADQNIITADQLTLDTLSSIFRHTSLARALSLAIPDYQVLRKIIGSDPFASTLDTIIFVRRTQKLMSSGFSLTELNWLLRHDFLDGSGISPRDADIAAILDDLRTKVQQVYLDNTLDPSFKDERGDLTKSKLAALQWDQKVVTQIIQTLSNTAIYETPLTSMPIDPSQFTATVRDKISYDASAQKLTYSCVMTTDDRTALLATQGMDALTSAAVGVLFDLPRKFLLRHMRSFTVPNYQVPLASMPVDVSIPVALRSKVYYDPSTAMLHSSGAITDNDQIALLQNVDPSTQAAYVTAIEALYAQPSSFTPVATDKFLDEVDISKLFDSSTLGSDLITPFTRFLYVLQKLLPNLAISLSRQAVVQILSQNLSLETRITDYLLNELASSAGATTLAQDFLSPAFAQVGLKVPSTALLFPNQFSNFMLLKKIALVISNFGFSYKQLLWVLNFPKLTGDPTSGWLNLNQLPVVFQPGPSLLFPGWERLNNLMQLCNDLRDGETVLDYVFGRVRQSGVTLDEISAYLSKQLSWSSDDVAFLIGSQGFRLTFPDAFKDEIALSRLARSLKMIRKVGCAASDALLLSNPDSGDNESRIAVQAAKSRYDGPTWESSIAGPLRNILRDRQRQSLVAYLVANSPVSQGSSWRNANDIFSYYLIDAEMGPCQLTSRIKQAICSVQLFVQRCLMNLENDVIASNEVDVGWEEWSWMKYQNVHGANYRILIYPELYLEADLRDDKTPFFTDLQTELQQADITTETVEAAFRNYLGKLEEVSRLTVVGLYHQQEYDLVGNLVIDVVHVVARTSGQAMNYYYRQRIDSSYWNAGWAKIDVDIEGDHTFPVIWNRKLFLFWGIFHQKQDGQPIVMPAKNESVPSSPPYLEIKMGWSHLEGAKWTAKQVSQDALDCPNDLTADEITFRTLLDETTNALQINCQQAAYSALPPDGGIFGRFIFDGWNKAPSVESGTFEEYQQYIITPSWTYLQNMAFQSSLHRAKHRGDPPLALPNGAFTSGGDWSTIQQEKQDVLVLNAVRGGYSIVPAHQDEQFSSQNPFFFQPTQKSFFVVPRTVRRLIRHLADKSLIDPSWLDGSVVAKYADTLKPILPKKNVPFAPKSKGGSPFFPFSAPLDAHAVSAQSQVTTSARGGEFLSGNRLLSPSIRRELLPPRIGPVKSLTRGLGKRPLPPKPPPRKSGPGNKYIPPSLKRKPSSPSSGIVKGVTIPVHFNLYDPTQYTFYLSYHPFVKDFIWHLNRDGIPGLMQRPVQMLGTAQETFSSNYSPSAAVVQDNGEFAEEVVDVNSGSYSVYNWELFYHIPLMIAERLSQNQQFEDAQKWFHYIFNPTDTSSFDSPQRFWQMKKFFQTEDAQYLDETLPALFEYQASQGDPNAYAKLKSDQKSAVNELEIAVAKWRQDPFMPFMVARTRTTAFQKSTVMKYLDNLIAWGDSLFMGDTIEMINEATQIYILAAEILGPRPAEIPSRVTPEVQTFNSLEPNLDSVSNALVQIEDFVPPVTSFRQRPISFRYRPTAPRPSMLFFCVPRNDKLLSYWDTVSDRLFKIRNCMNLQGIVRQLALFDPPIDPLLLARAAASGVDLSSALNDINAPLPQRRFSVLVLKAIDMANELKSLGSAFMSALEKRDSETLALIRSRQEISVIDAVKAMKKQALQDANYTVDGLKAGKDTVQERYNHYSTIEFMNPWEWTSMGLESAVLVGLVIESASHIVAGTAAAFPDAKLGAPTSIGVTYGGSNFAKMAKSFADFMATNAQLVKQTTSMTSTLGSYYRRKDDWDLQATLASKELAQLDKNIAAAEVKAAMAQTDIDNSDLQRKNAKEIDDYMKSKFNNADLYDWSVGQLSTIYFQSYQMAYEAAKKAEMAYAFELGVSNPGFIHFGQWDSLKKGLLVGEKLLHDIKRMDLSFVDLDRREYEITSSISLAQLDPLAFMQLRENQEAFFALPEAIFDLSYPGHYLRRIKSIALTIPCVVGPYTSVNCTLSMLKSSIRNTPALVNGAYARRDNDIRFVDSYGQFQSIVTSNGQNDSGLFELNLHDDKFLPFERAGAVSSWRIQLPKTFKQFDYRAMTDVIIRIQYTAREGGDQLRAQVETELQAKLLSAISLAESQNGLARLLSLRHDFPDAWYRFFVKFAAAATATTTATTSSTATSSAAAPTGSRMPLDLSNLRFPYVFNSTTIKIERIQLYIAINPAYAKDYANDTMSFWLEPKPTGTGGDISTKPEDALKLGPWNGLLRAGKVFGVPAGGWVLGGALNSGEAMVGDAFQDVWIAVQYSVKAAAAATSS